MKRLRCVCLLPLLAILAWGQGAPQGKPSALPNQPDALVSSLYAQVVARHPLGIPDGPNMKVFAPYLSKGLLHRIDLATACSADWNRQNPDPQLTAKIASEDGLFSGEGVEATAQAFQIEKTEPEKDGSSRVYVSLTWKKHSQERPWTWRVAAVVLKENGHFVIDDVIYIDDAVYDREQDRRDKRLSEYLSAGCTGPRWGGHTLPNQPDALVRSLYAQVVARHPVGIPGGADWKIFAPYLSKTLLHRIDLAIACGADWSRQNPDPDLKPPIGWLELGLFSGGEEDAEPQAFHIERTESEKDGSLRVYVGLTGGSPPESQWSWRVAASLVRENGRPVVDDVVYLKDKNNPTDVRLSKLLSEGCNGPRWVGESNKSR